MTTESNKSMKRGGKASTPVYKKWWFWVIIVVVICIIGGASANKSEEPAKVGETSSTSSQTSDTTNSATSEFQVGDIVDIDGQEISVTSVEFNYSTGNSWVEPSDGKQFVKVNVQIKNTSDEKIDYNVFYWEMEDDNGDIYDYSSAMMAQADDSLSSGELAVGGTKTGSIVFEAPINSTSLKIHFQPNLWSSTEAVIKLQ